MWIDIKDAPWTDEQIKAVLAMGIERAEWGYPDVVLDDPVLYFGKSSADTAKLLSTEQDGNRHTSKENDEKEHPFQTVAESEI